MLSQSKQCQLIIGLGLTALIIATRGQHFATVSQLPGASWAVFFLAGVYLQSRWVLPGLLALTWGLDFASYQWGTSSGFCLTAAYGFLLPAYASMWLAGQWYARKHEFKWRTLMPLSLSVVLGSMLCEVFSSGGFYFFSGRFIDPTLIEFGSRLMKYYPAYLSAVVFYVGIATLVHCVFTLARSSISQHNATVKL